MAQPNIRIIALGVMKFTILVDPFTVICTIYSVCLIYTQKQRRIIKKLYIFTITSHVLANAKKPWPGCHEINDIVSLFLAHQYYTAIKWLRYCRYSVNHYLINQSLLYTQVVSPLPSSRETDYIKKHFTLIIPKLSFWSGDHGIYVSLSYRCYKTNLVKIGLVVLEKNMLTLTHSNKPYPSINHFVSLSYS